MARLNDEFLLAWSALQSSEAAAGWQVISLPPSGPVGISAGRNFPDNTEAALFYFPSAKLARAERLPVGKGFAIERADSGIEPGLRLALTRQEAGSTELFSSMVFDVVGSIDNGANTGESEAKLLRILIARVIGWQRFMSRGAALLNREAELGLVGELHFMKLLLDAGVSQDLALSGWVGPDDAPQDFLLGDGAIEVKSTMSQKGLSVKVGSLEQLDDSLASPLFLAAVRFSREESGLTLPEMIAELERRLNTASDLFRERLLHAGYIETHAVNYTRRFESKEVQIFCVTEGFPRLTTGLVPQGVTRALYEINLNHAQSFRSSMDVAMVVLGAIR